MGEIPVAEVARATPEPSSWLNLKVFFLRVSRCEVNESMADSLTVTHAPLTPGTVLEVNGGSVVSSGHVSLRMDRAGAVSEGGGGACTFVSTADVRVSRSVRFEVQGGGERLLVGILETCDAGAAGKGGGWAMKCQVAVQRGSGLLRRGKETKPPVVEVYVAGLARGAPVIFTKAMQLRFRRRRQAKAFMEPIPECGEPAEDVKEMLPPKHQTEAASEYRCYRPEPDGGDADCDGYYVSPAGEEGEDGDFSWFTAGVRVGVGISVGICLGIGIGAGLLARSYHSTSRSLKSRLISSLL
ncbi:uncharacterized protein At1g01500-like [Oryza brachyantha]|uniref:uncharacterized protein At1g01500-like n=1 Tax=Oryza brachyantha TaxID=4533 RepID=UPI001ADC1037|nr:uncharacterized protein At1g01500-like [Oryza brachyantha]